MNEPYESRGAPRVALVGYRHWAQQVINRFTIDPDYPAVTGYEHVSEVPPEAEVVILIGVSEIVPPDFYRLRTVLVVHPSPLPRYRGGSPIQHQMLSGEPVSAVSIFRLLPGAPLDGGPLCYQQMFALPSTLDDVLDAIRDITVEAIEKILNRVRNRGEDGITYWPQQGEPTTFARRRPVQSVINTEKWQPSAIDLRAIDRLVRALHSDTEDYPAARIVSPSGARLEILRTRYTPGPSDAE